MIPVRTLYTHDLTNITYTHVIHLYSKLDMFIKSFDILSFCCDKANKKLNLHT